MINIEYPMFTVQNSSLGRLFSSKEAIKALAAQLIAGQVEAHLDIISDAGTAEYGTYQEVADAVGNAKETVKDYIEDLLLDFRNDLLREINNAKVTTNAVLLKPEGEIDADVTVRTE